MNRQVPSQPIRRVSDIIVPSRSVPKVQKRAWRRELLHSRRFLPLVIICAILLLGVAGVFIVHLRSSSSTGVTALQEVEKQVGRHYLLPTDEQPALVTVEDETKVTSPFLRQAKNGDKLLVYANAKIVIIYRPSIDRIVAVGPVFIDTSKTSTTQ